jgi:tRNA threonylcarbamoyladenosine biosynthesis protein TsaE
MSSVDKPGADDTVLPAIDISALSATERLAQALASQAAWLRGKVVYLHGDLGAGKTTLVRHLLRALGETGKVKSPTYGLMECYQPTAGSAPGLKILHLDLYRLQDPEELEYLGMRDLLDADTLLLVEWPERGRGVLPAADATIDLVQSLQQRSAEIRPQALADAVLAQMPLD